MGMELDGLQGPFQSKPLWLWFYDEAPHSALIFFPRFSQFCLFFSSKSEAVQLWHDCTKYNLSQPPWSSSAQFSCVSSGSHLPGKPHEDTSKAGSALLFPFSPFTLPFLLSSLTKFSHLTEKSCQTFAWVQRHPLKQNILKLVQILHAQSSAPLFEGTLLKGRWARRILMEIFSIIGGCKTAEQFYFFSARSFVRNRNAPFLLYWLEFHLLVLTLFNFPLIRLPVRFFIVEGILIII